MALARRIVAFDWLTADGYFSGSDGNLDWVVAADEQAKAAATSTTAADTLRFGRRTYERFEKFWRTAVNDSATAPDPHRPGQQSREHRVIAVWINEATKLVFSRTLKVFLGDGRRLLEGLSKSVTLELLETRKYPSGDVLLRYAPRLA